MSMQIGSGDVTALMAGKASLSHIDLLTRFVSGVKPIYNAKASPIDALRTGAILEERYLFTLPDDYFIQFVCVSDEMNVFKCSLDFAKVSNGEVVDFDELKTVHLNDYLAFEPIKNDSAKLLEYVKKKYKHYYYQVQEQLYCTKLEEANIVFLSVFSYDDDVNRSRVIQPNEYIKVRIFKDESVISEIKQRGLIFQQIKNEYE